MDKTTTTSNAAVATAVIKGSEQKGAYGPKNAELAVVALLWLVVPALFKLGSFDLRIIEYGVVAFVVLGVLVTFSNVFGLLFILLVSRPMIDMLGYSDIGVYGYSAIQLLSGFLVLLLLTHVLVATITSRFPPLAVLTMAFSLVLLVAFVRSVSWRIGMLESLRYLSPFVLWWAVFVALEKHSVGDLETVAFRGVIYAMPVVVGSVLSGGEATKYLGTAGIELSKGLFSNPHTLALFVLVAVVLLVHRFSIEEFPLRRVVYAGFICVCLFVLVKANVRTAQIGLIIYFSLYVRSRWQLMWALAVLILCVALVVVVPDLRFRWIELFDRLIDPSQRSTAGSGRLYIWELYWSKYQASGPLVWLDGFGFGRWQEGRSSTQSTGLGINTHGDYLFLLLNFGLIGVVTYVWMMLRAFALTLGAGRNVDERDLSIVQSFQAYFVSTLVMAGVSNAFVTRVSISWYFWFLGALAVAVMMRGRRVRSLAG